ncbi:hypothetical protein CGCVW01_v011840 [Colletotrichum viniferum]|nr:hypothetical protein CGCVW01_v011840 [Colletotrichum viniferum]
MPTGSSERKLGFGKPAAAPPRGCTPLSLIGNVNGAHGTAPGAGERLGGKTVGREARVESSMARKKVLRRRGSPRDAAQAANEGERWLGIQLGPEPSGMNGAAIDPKKNQPCSSTMKNRETLIIGTPDSQAHRAGADRLMDASKHETVSR